MKTLHLVLLLGLIAASNTLTIKLESSKPYCMYFKGNGIYNLEYVVSGQEDRKVKMQMYEGEDFMLKQEGVNEYYTQQKFRSEKVKICFTRLDKKQKEISFDYYVEDDPIKEMIDRKDLMYVSNSANEAIKNLKEVSKKQEYHIERDEINRLILEKSENHIKWAGIIKIAFLLTSALIQLWIMKSFFKQNSIPYQSVSTE